MSTILFTQFITVNVDGESEKETFEWMYKYVEWFVSLLSFNCRIPPLINPPPPNNSNTLGLLRLRFLRDLMRDFVIIGIWNIKPLEYSIEWLISTIGSMWWRLLIHVYVLELDNEMISTNFASSFCSHLKVNIKPKTLGPVYF